MPGAALRSILGFGSGSSSSGRVKKRISSTAAARKPSEPASAAAKWPSSLPRTKSNTGTAPPTKPTTSPTTATTTTTTTTTITTPEPLLPLLQNLLSNSLFPPLPPPTSLSSTQTSHLLLSRARLPPVLTTSHLHAATGSPTSTDRALDALVRAGTIRRVVVPRRGELLILTSDLERLSPPARWMAWLKSNPGALVYDGDGGLEREEVDELVRGGWLTAIHHEDGWGMKGGRSGLVSLERAAGEGAGTVGATGGVGVVWEVGTGVRGKGEGGRFRVAVPGAGTYFKLVTGAVEYLGELLGRHGGGEMAEGDLRGKWDGGVVGEGKAAQAKKGRGQFVGVVEGKTRRWREFLGMEFDWVLREAVGAGTVEVFETGSVGRGVRRLR